MQSQARKEKSISFPEFIKKAEGELVKAIIKVWSLRQSSEKRIKAYIRAVSGLCLCSVKRFQNEIDDYNVRTLNKSIYEECKSKASMRERYHDANIVFRRLILSGVHKGSNPCDSIKTPKCAKERKTVELGYAQAVMVLNAIRERKSLANINELQLFFILCFETGQRPKDVYLFDARKITDGHYRFYSHKTERSQRVSHILSRKVCILISEIQRAREKSFYEQHFTNEYTGCETLECFWRRSYSTMTNALNSIIHEVLGKDVSLYAAKHFFISEVFRMTESEFWAEAFTHEGRTANSIHYLHPDQSRADEIMIEYQQRFDEIIKQAGSPSMASDFGMYGVLGPNKLNP